MNDYQKNIYYYVKVKQNIFNQSEYQYFVQSKNKQTGIEKNIGIFDSCIKAKKMLRALNLKQFLIFMKKVYYIETVMDNPTRGGTFLTFCLNIFFRDQSKYVLRCINTETAENKIIASFKSLHEAQELLNKIKNND